MVMLEREAAMLQAKGYAVQEGTLATAQTNLMIWKVPNGQTIWKDACRPFERAF